MVNKLQDRYDWIVLGDHPGALFSACLAAKLGLSVLIVPFEESLGLKFSSTGEFLDLESNFLLSLDSSEGFIGKSLVKLGLLPAEESLLVDRPSVSQIITPQLRLDLKNWAEDESIWQRAFGLSPAVAKTYQAELIRFRNEALELWNSLPARLTVNFSTKKNSTERKMSKKPDYSGASKLAPKSKIRALKDYSPESWNHFSRALEFGLGGRLVDSASVQESAMTLALGTTGASVVGGWSAYRELLLRMARRLGADAPAHTMCSRIFVERGRFVGIQLSHQGNEITGGAALLGCSVSRAKSRMTFSGSRLFKKLKPSPKPLGWKFTLAITVNAEAIPPGMSDRATWCERDAPPLEIEVVKPQDYGVRDPDHRVLMVRTVVPYQPETLEPGYQRVIASRMFRQVSELLPFLEYHVKKIYPDFRNGTRSFLESLNAQSPSEQASESEMRKLYGFANLEAIPDALLCSGGPGVGIQSGIENLFCASSESFPELGSLGAFSAGMQATAWLAHRAGLPGPLTT